MVALKEILAKENEAELATKEVLGDGFPRELRTRLQRMAGGPEKLNLMVLQVLSDHAEKLDRLARHLAGEDQQALPKISSDLVRIRNDMRELKNNVPGDLDGRLYRLEEHLLAQQNMVYETHKMLALLIAEGGGDK